MNKENPILKVTKDIVDSVEENAEPFFSEADPDKMVHFVRNTSLRIKKEQPKLFEFIRNPEKYVKINRPLIYGTGTAFAYEMLSKSFSEKEKIMQIQSSTIAAFCSHIIESVEIEDETTGKADLNLKWVTNKITNDCPYFAEWFGSMISGIEEDNNRSDFILGVTFVLIPFYIQEETKRMESSLSERLAKVIN